MSNSVPSPADIPDQNTGLEEVAITSQEFAQCSKDAIGENVFDIVGILKGLGSEFSSRYHTQIEHVRTLFDRKQYTPNNLTEELWQESRQQALDGTRVELVQTLQSIDHPEIPSIISRIDDQSELIASKVRALFAKKRAIQKLDAEKQRVIGFSASEYGRLTGEIFKQVSVFRAESTQNSNENSSIPFSIVEDVWRICLHDSLVFPTFPAVVVHDIRVESPHIERIVEFCIQLTRELTAVVERYRELPIDKQSAKVILSDMHRILDESTARLSHLRGDEATVIKTILERGRHAGCRLVDTINVICSGNPVMTTLQYADVAGSPRLGAKYKQHVQEMRDILEGRERDAFLSELANASKFDIRIGDLPVLVDYESAGRLLMQSLGQVEQRFRKNKKIRPETTDKMVENRKMHIDAVMRLCAGVLKSQQDPPPRVQDGTSRSLESLEKQFISGDELLWLQNIMVAEVDSTERLSNIDKYYAFVRAHDADELLAYVRSNLLHVGNEVRRIVSRYAQGDVSRDKFNELVGIMSHHIKGLGDDLGKRRHWLTTLVANQIHESFALFIERVGTALEDSAVPSERSITGDPLLSELSLLCSGSTRKAQLPFQDFSGFYQEIRGMTPKNFTKRSQFDIAKATIINGFEARLVRGYYLSSQISPDQLTTAVRNFSQGVEEIFSRAIAQFESTEVDDGTVDKGAIVLYAAVQGSRRVDAYLNPKVKIRFIDEFGITYDDFLGLFDAEIAQLALKLPPKVTPDDIRQFAKDFRLIFGKFKLKFEQVKNEEFIQQTFDAYEQGIRDWESLPEKMLSGFFRKKIDEQSIHVSLLRSKLMGGIREIKNSGHRLVAATFINQVETYFESALDDGGYDQFTTKDLDELETMLDAQIRRREFNIEVAFNLKESKRLNQQESSEIQIVSNQLHQIVKKSIKWAKSQIAQPEGNTKKKSGPVKETTSIYIDLSKDPFQDLAEWENKCSLSRDLFMRLLVTASGNSDEELGHSFNKKFGQKIMEMVVGNCPENIQSSDTMIGIFAWLYGVTYGLNSTTHHDYTQPDSDREVNIRNYERVLQLIVQKFWPDQVNTGLTMEAIACGSHAAFEDRTIPGLNTQDCIEAIIVELNKASGKFIGGKGKHHLNEYARETFIENRNTSFKALRSFAKIHLPEQIITNHTFACINAFVSEMVFAWAAAMSTAGCDQVIMNSIENALYAANVRKVNEWQRIIVRQLAEEKERNTHPIIVIPQTRAEQPTPEVNRTNPTNFWMQTLQRQLGVCMHEFVLACHKEGVYFASLQQEERTLNAIRSFFEDQESAFYNAIQKSCPPPHSQLLKDVPVLPVLRDNVHGVIETMNVPPDLPHTISQLLFDHIQMRLFAVYERLDFQRNPISVGAEYEWRKELRQLGVNATNGSTEFSTEQLAEASSSMKLAFTAAIMQKLAATAMQEVKGSAIDVQEFDIRWTQVVSRTVAEGIDQYVQKQPRKGKYIQDVIHQLFDAARQTALLARIGSSVEQGLKEASSGTIAEHIVRSARSISPINLTDAHPQTVDEIERQLLQAIGRTEHFSFLDVELAVLDQFLKQLMASDASIADQILESADQVAELVAQLNNRFHAGVGYRTVDEVMEYLAGRGIELQRLVRESRKREEKPLVVSESAERLQTVCIENEAWMSSWPTELLNPDQLAGFAQVVRRWHESSTIIALRSKALIVDEQQIRLSLVDAETVRHIREKGIIEILRPEESGDARRRKFGLRIQQSKVAGLLDWREMQITALQLPGVATELDSDTASVMKDFFALSNELGALEATLDLTADDRRQIEHQRSTLDQQQHLLAGMRDERDAMQRDFSAAETSLMSSLPCISPLIAESNRWVAVLQGQIEEEERMLQAAHQAMEQARTRLSQYTERGGRAADRILELSSALDAAEQSHKRLSIEITQRDLKRVLRDVQARIGQLEEHQRAFPVDVAAEISAVTCENAQELLQRSSDLVGRCDDVFLLREDIVSLDQRISSLESLLRNVQQEELLDGSKVALRARRLTIMQALSQVKDLLSSVLRTPTDA